MGRDHQLNAELHNALSVMFQSERVFDRALLHAERALKCAEAYNDPNHIRVLQAKVSQALSILNLGRPAEAETAYRDLLESFRQIKDSEGIAQTMIGLGAALREQGRYADAERTLVEAVETQKSLQNPDLRTISQSLSTLGSLYGELGDDERARHYQEEALKVAREAWGAGHAMLFDRLTGLARTLRHLKAYDDARPLLAEAREIAITSGGPQSPQLALLNGTDGRSRAHCGSHRQATSPAKPTGLGRLSRTSSRTRPPCRRTRSQVG